MDGQEKQDKPSEVPVCKFVETTAFSHFAQRCEEWRRSRSIAVCLGPSGVGKTQAARHYADWDQVSSRLSTRSMEAVSPSSVMPHAAFYTAKLLATPKSVKRDLEELYADLEAMAQRGRGLVQEEANAEPAPIGSVGVDLTVVDEVDRLSNKSLQVLCDLYDHKQMGLVLLVRPGTGMRRLDRHPLISRVAVRYEFGALEQREVRLFLEQHLQDKGLIADEMAVKVFIETTSGNFWIMSHIFDHLERMIHHRGAFPVTADVIQEIAVRLLCARNLDLS